MDHSAAEIKDLATLTSEVSNLTKTWDEHKKAHKELTEAVQKLVTTWDQANGVLRFIKWISVVAAACAAIWVAFKGNFVHS